MNKEKDLDIKKFEYVLDQFKRARNKKYESYCVTRIYHLLNRNDIQIITQQMMRRTNKTIALADLYFPQLDIWVEIDESHHNTNEDEIRTKEVLDKEISKKLSQLEEVINVKNEPERIPVVDKGLNEINDRIDEIVAKIKLKIKEKENNNSLLTWEVEPKKPQYYIDKGNIDVNERSAFHTIQEVSDLFNKNYEGVQKCYFSDFEGSKDKVWCPKLKLEEDEKGRFDNFISSDEKFIYELDPNKSDNENLESAIWQNENGLITRFVFLKFKDFSGKSMYRFKGVYDLDIELSKAENMCVYKRKDTKINLKKYHFKNN